MHLPSFAASDASCLEGGRLWISHPPRRAIALQKMVISQKEANRRMRTFLTEISAFLICVTGEQRRPEASSPKRYFSSSPWVPLSRRARSRTGKNEYSGMVSIDVHHVYSSRQMIESTLYYKH